MEEERRKLRIAIEEKAVRDLENHMRLEDAEKEQRKKWHAVREIPLALIYTIILQTVLGAGTLGAFAASTTAKFDALDKAGTAYQAVQISVDKRQDEDARRSEDRILAELRDIKLQLNKIAEQRK